MDIVDCGVLTAGVPVWAVSWFLNSEVRGLSETVAERFRNMRVRELMADPLSYMDEDFVRELSPQANEELACAIYLVAEKAKDGG